jgi:hypothetical protein
MSAALHEVGDWPTPRDWIVEDGQDGDWGQYEVRVEITSDSVYIGLYDAISDGTEAESIKMWPTAARKLGEKIIEACDLAKDVPSRYSPATDKAPPLGHVGRGRRAAYRRRASRVP